MHRQPVLMGFLGALLAASPLWAATPDGGLQADAGAKPDAGNAAINSAIDRPFTAGDESSPVKIVLYGCCRCPVCAGLVPELYAEVTSGRLKSKAYLILHLVLKPERPGSVEGGTAAMAVARQNRLWPFMLRVFQDQDSYFNGFETKTAMETGVDMDAYGMAKDDPQFKKMLLELIEVSKDIKKTPLV
ncbi:MAG: thioredoxin domain-containing protein, partial [Myxococcota bacterium]